MNGDTLKTRSNARVHRVAASRDLGVPGLLVLAAGTALSIQSAQAQIQGAQVTHGSATFQTSGNRTVIQAADNTVINYRQFDIAAGQTVQFVQPSADSRVLNRITSSAPTRIDGSLIANGNVYVVNPAGVVFGKNAIIDAARFVAAAAKISDRDFLSGTDHFASVSGRVTNDGAIDAGSVHLIGTLAENHGAIVASGGVVTMLSGSDVYLREEGSRVSVRIDGKDLNPATGAVAPVAQRPRQTLQPLGTVVTQQKKFTSLGAGDVVSLAVHNTGSIRVGSGGATLGSVNGEVTNSGTVSADVESGTAGTVKLQGQRVTHSGVITAVAKNGRSGSVEVTSSKGTVLAPGSRISVAGGSGLADAGSVLVHSYSGSTLFADGATIDLSGGELGGNAGFGEVSAYDGLGFQGRVFARRQDGYADAELFLDPRDVYISSLTTNNGTLGDGLIGALEDVSLDYFVSAAAIEEFLGNVRIEASRDILISQSIDKTNGDLTLIAGHDIVFGVAPTITCPPPPPPPPPCDPPPCNPPPCVPPPPCNPPPPPHGDEDCDRSGKGGNRHDYERERENRHRIEERCETPKHHWNTCEAPPVCAPPPCAPPPCPPPVCPPPTCPPPPPPGGETCPPPAPIDSITVAANGLVMVAEHSILDQTTSGAHLRAHVTDVVLQGTQGVVEFGDVLVPSWQAVHINQGESRVIGTAPGGVILNSPETFLNVKSFNGSVTFATPDSSQQVFAGINAQAKTDIVIDSPLLACYDGIFKAGDNVLIGADVLSDVGFLWFNSGYNGTGGDVSFTRPGLIIGARDISLIAGGVGIGGDARVDALTNSPEFRNSLGAEGTSPNRFVFGQNPTVTSEDLPRYEQFGGGLSCDTAYIVQSYDGDIVLNDGSPVAHSDLTLSSASAFDASSAARSYINADLDLCTLVVQGAGTLNGDVTTVNTQTYEGNVIVQSNVRLTGKQVFFRDVVEGIGFGLGGLTVDAQVFFDRNVGLSSPLAYLTTNREATLGAGDLATIVVQTTGDQRYNGDVTLASDANMVSLSGGVVRFGGLLDGPHSMNVATPNGLIVFGGDVGSLRPLHSISLCTDLLFYPVTADGIVLPMSGDRMLGIPRRATIVGEHDLSIHAQDFSVCNGEKFTVLGNLLVDATTSATLGDVTTVGDMRIVAPSITLLRRPASDLYGVDGSLRDDLGVDYVAGGAVIMDGAIFLGGSDSLPPPRFGSAVDSFSENLSGFETREMDPAETSIDALVDDLMRVLDQRVPFDIEPPPPPPPQAELADARPRDPRFVDSVKPTVYDLELLRAVALSGSGAGASNTMGGARSLYADLPPGTQYDPQLMSVAATRFDIHSVEKVVAMHDGIFHAGGSDQTQDIQEAFQRAATLYRVSARVETIDPHEFAAYVREQPALSPTRDRMLDVQRLLDRVRDLGLTPIEYVAMRNRMLAPLAPVGSGLDIATLAHMLTAVQMDESQQPARTASL